MTARYLLSKEVLCLTLRLPKEDAGYFIHLLEAQDNMCFPTTLENPKGAGWRDLLVRAPIEWADELRRFVEQFKKEVPALEILEDQVILDSN